MLNKRPTKLIKKVILIRVIKLILSAIFPEINPPITSNIQIINLI